MSTPHQKHLNRVRDAMRAWGADLMFLNFGPDMTYVTGLLTPRYYDSLKGKGDWINGLLFGVDKEPVLLLQRSMAMDNITAKTWVKDIRVLPDGADPDAFLGQTLAEFEPAGKTVAVTKRLWSHTLLALQLLTPAARFVPATDSMLDLARSIKDDYELAVMSRAAEITDIALLETVKRLKIGMTENDVATEVVYQIKQAGGDGYSFYPGIICVGNDSDPNRDIMTRNTGMRLASGTTVAFDFGVLYEGYCSDFGRSVFVGKVTPAALDAYRCITEGARAVWELMGDGKIAPYQTQEFMVARTAAEGFGDYYYKWGLGHAIGLDVHEDPWLRVGFTEPIRAGMCFTVEPKIWKPGEFYVRCEDVVVVGKDRATPLTKYHYDPILIE